TELVHKNPGMKKTLLLFPLSLFFLLFPSSGAEAGGPLPPPDIHEVSVLTPSVEQYGKFEATISLSATFTNPYDYSQVAVRGTFTSPSGAEKAVDGFFMQDYTLNSITGSLASAGPGGFRLRFSPDEAGTWSFVVSV